MKFINESTKSKRKEARRLQQVATGLQVKFPAPCACTVRLVDDIPNCHGTCAFEAKDGVPHIEIQVEWSRDMTLMVDSLIHEWAHALTLPTLAPWQQQHCDEFWLSMGRCYRWLHDDNGLEAVAGLEVS